MRAQREGAPPPCLGALARFFRLSFLSCPASFLAFSQAEGLSTTLKNVRCVGLVGEGEGVVGADAAVAKCPEGKGGRKGVGAVVSSARHGGANAAARAYGRAGGLVMYTRRRCETANRGRAKSSAARTRI